jgi:hypothetical protein
LGFSTARYGLTWLFSYLGFPCDALRLSACVAIVIPTSGFTESSSSTVSICRQNINLTPITYDGCAKAFSKRYVYNRGFLLSRGCAATAAQQLDPYIADQPLSLWLLALCRLRRTRDRCHVVSIGYSGCCSGRRHGRSTPLVRSIIGNG